MFDNSEVRIVASLIRPHMDDALGTLIDFLEKQIMRMFFLQNEYCDLFKNRLIFKDTPCGLGNIDECWKSALCELIYWSGEIRSGSFSLYKEDDIDLLLSLPEPKDALDYLALGAFRTCWFFEKEKEKEKLVNK